VKKNKGVQSCGEELEMAREVSWITESVINAALQDREIYIRGVILSDTAYFVERMFNKLRKIDLIRGVGYPINIIIDSEGGSLFSAFQIISKIKEFQNMGYIVRTSSVGIAMSAALLILMCGTKEHRSASLLSRMMYHQPSSMIGFSVQTFEDSVRDTEEFSKLWNKIRELTIEHTSISDMWLIDEVQKKNINHYFWPDEALSLGIIDYIIGEKSIDEGMG